MLTSLILDVLGSFSWTRNGTHFDIDKDPLVTMKPGSGTLTINIMSEGKAETYEGVYQCTARNERGAAISNNIVVRPSSKWDLSTKQDPISRLALRLSICYLQIPSRYSYKKAMLLIQLLALCFA